LQGRMKNMGVGPLQIIIFLLPLISLLTKLPSEVDVFLIQRLRADSHFQLWGGYCFF